MIQTSIVLGRQPTWLLDLEWAGRTWRFSSGDEMDVRLLDGTHRYRSGLVPPAVPEAVDLWSSEAVVASVSIEVIPPNDMAVSSLVSGGHVLAAATATLRVCYDASTSDGTRAVLAGRVTEPVYGPPGVALAFALEAFADTSTTTLPEPSAVVDLATWVGLGDSAAQGKHYPIPIGKPGGHVGDSAGALTFTRGSPALWVSGRLLGSNYILVAGAPVEAASVYLWNNTDTTKSFSASVVRAADGRGRVVSVVTWPDAAHKPSEGDDLWVGWDPTGGGGITNPYGVGCLEGAGDVIRWVLDQSGRQWDRANASDLQSLNAIRIATYISEPVDPWEWLVSEVLPLLPVSVIRVAEGIRVVPWRYRAGARDAVLALEAGRNCERASNAVSVWPSPANRITIQFASRGDTGSTLESTTAAGALDISDSDVYRHPLCSRSVAALRTAGDSGHRALVVSAPVVADRASAELVLDYLAHRYALPREVFGYSVRPDVGERLDPGSVVALTDTEMGWSGRVCHVLARAYDGPWVTLTLGHWETD